MTQTQSAADAAIRLRIEASSGTRTSSVGRSLADDALQDVFLWLARKGAPEEIAGDASRFHRYLCGAVRRHRADLHRREARHAHAALDTTSFAACDTSMRDESARLVHAALAHLTAAGDHGAANLLNLRFLDGFSVAKIAARLCKSPKVVSASLQRAKRKFMLAWAALGGGL